MPFQPAPKISCKVCTNAVYPLEQIQVTEGVFHRSCFRCTTCNKVVSNTTYSAYEGIIFCKPHLIAAFKKRGKYNDIANARAPSQERRSTFSAAEKPAESYGTQGRRNTWTPSGSKDLSSVLRKRNPDDVESVIKEQGLKAVFESGSDGATPLELAFSSGNIDCGRVMIQALKEALDKYASGSTEWSGVGGDLSNNKISSRIKAVFEEDNAGETMDYTSKKDPSSEEYLPEAGDQNNENLLRA